MSNSKEYNREYGKKYRKTTHGKELIRKNQREMYKRRKKFILDYKSIHPCIICGESNPICLDFHHQGEKDLTIGNSAFVSLERLINEMDKCIVLCANCHRKIHANEDLFYLN